MFFRKKQAPRPQVRSKAVTLGLWLEAHRVLGIAEGEDFDAANADADLCARLVACLLEETPYETYTEDGIREVAGACWAALHRSAEEARARARRRVEEIELSLGHFLDDSRPLSIERVLTSYGPKDYEALTRLPMGEALLYLGVRAVDNDFRKTNEEALRYGRPRSN